MRWAYWYTALACVLVGLWMTGSEPWWYSLPLYFSGLCLGLIAVNERSE